jgi:phosphoadenosine phosphosulfate reductase
MEDIADLVVPIETELLGRLRRIASRHSRAALASSLGAEDMVLLDAIVRSGATIDVFFIDTGRLHAETLQLLDVARARYGRPIKVYRPLDAAVADFVRQHGANGFYDGVAERHLCCGIRKVEPLGPGARRPRRLAHRAAPRPGPRARVARARGDRHRPRHRQAQPARLLVRRRCARLCRAPRTCR